MNIFVSGVSFRKTPVKIREKLHINDNEELKDILFELRSMHEVKECVVLSTCNRTEIYFYSDLDDIDVSLVEKILCEKKKQNYFDIKKYFYNFVGADAINHIFKVASSMDSMIFGEDQILGQFKQAHNIAMEQYSCGPVLNTLLRQAITASKIIKTRLPEMIDKTSISSYSIDLIREIYSEDLAEKNIMVIGSGKIGMLILEKLQKTGLKKIFLLSRKISRLEIAKNIEMIDYEERYPLIDSCDIIISSTKSPHYTITRENVEEYLGVTKNPKLFIDLAVPRDIDPQIAELENVKLINIDHFENMDMIKSKKRLNMKYVEEVNDKQINEFYRWYKFRNSLVNV